MYKNLFTYSGCYQFLSLKPKLYSKSKINYKHRSQTLRQLNQNLGSIKFKISTVIIEVDSS